jgi:hypothetical protein
LGKDVNFGQKGEDDAASEASWTKEKRTSGFEEKQNVRQDLRKFDAKVDKPSLS